jgi:TolB-like protein/class 3 adenylate cyclase/Tfp pilus assembly protein PilF
MGDRATNRRLAAILAADVVGYSRMMAANEAATLSALRRHRETIFNPAVAAHNGRIVKLIGDGTLVEFTSAVDAVGCALAIQNQAAAAKQDGAPAIVLRIGINLGDIVVEGDDIFGDGVNVAARLEPLADPGGICIAAIVRETLGGRLDAPFTDAGEVNVKNIDRAIRIWKWHPDGAAVETGTQTETAHPALPGKPSIAVLPFTNLSGDAEQDYFADGICEDIITALSRIRWFFVIARNTTFTYKGKAVDIQQVARELGVRYVLEGSVRKAGGRIRITAQLIEGETGNHIWAERYDRNLEDIFEIQDEITENIAGALEPQLANAEYLRSRRKNPQNLDAWDLVIQAMARIGEFSRDGSAKAVELLDRAIAIDPTYARAYSHKAWILAWRIHQGFADASTLPQAIDAAETAIRYDPDEPWAYIARLFIANHTRDIDRCFTSARRAIELNPNFALAHSFLGVVYALTGRGNEAFPHIERARRLSPRDIFRDEFDLHSSMANFQIADYRKAAEYAANALLARPEHVYPHMMRASSFGHLGETELAREEVATIRRLAPDYTLGKIEKASVYMDPNDRLRFVDGLRKAGFPE